MTEAASCAGPNKPPRCKQKFKSKGKSKETKGSILGTLGAIAGGLGGYAAYKKLKEQQKGGTTKYQKGGSAPHGPGSMTHGTVPPMVNEPAKSKKLKVKDLVINTEGAKKAKQNAMKRQLRKHQNGGASDPIKAMYKAKGEKMPTTKETLEYVSKNSSGYIPSNKSSKVDTTNWKEKMKAPDAKKYQKGGTTKPTPKRTTVPKKYVDSAIPTYKGPDAPMPKTARAQNGGTTYKTGGMVNPNAKLQAAKSAGSKGVKSGVNPKAAASKVARGRSGGTSVAPKKALPKAQKGWSVDDPYKRGVMGEGASATKTRDRKVGGLGVIKGGTRTKTISAGGIYPGAKGSVNVTKTDNSGKVTSSRTRSISQDKANRMINKKRG